MYGFPYTISVRRIYLTRSFSEWLDDQPDPIRHRIDARLVLIRQGHFGDVKRFDGLTELRWKNGLRVYVLKSQTGFSSY